MVKATTFSRRGDHNWIVQHLRDARRAGISLERGVTGPRFIQNVTPSGLFLGDAAETLESIKTCLRQSNRLFRQGNSVVFLMNGYSPSGACIARPLVVDGVVTRIASAVVSNVVYCREMKANSTGKGAKVDQPAVYPVEFAVPQSVLQQVVVRDNFMMGIPEARLIVSHPVFDQDFNWLDVGYHGGSCILICGESFDPMNLPPLAAGLKPPETVEDVLDRLPRLMRTWMRGFHWNSPTDLINYIAGPLMIVLMPMFIEAGHPAIMFWGNKPGIGKSLAAQCLAILKDGEQAAASSMEGGAKEIENQIASEMNDGRTTLFFDNQKGQINCPTLEANITDAELGYRVMFAQSKVRRPNDVLWLFTTNDGKPSEDLLVRCIHVRLHYEGDPGMHQFLMTEDEVVGFVKENRAGILAEAAGMVRRWLDAGRVMVRTAGRFEKFNDIVGSVLAANGLPGVLSNTREEVRQHSTTHQQLVAIAERLIDGRDRSFVWEVEGDIDTADEEFKRGPRPENPREQKDWVHILTSAGVISAANTTAENQKTAATQYLRGIVNVPVDVDVGEQTVQAKVVSRKLGARRTAYVLAVKGLSAVVATDGGVAGTNDVGAAFGAASEAVARPEGISGQGAAQHGLHGDVTAGDGDGGPELVVGPADDEEQEDDLWGATSG
jgi:DNA polymerase III delta prime subunit